MAKHPVRGILRSSLFVLCIAALCRGEAAAEPASAPAGDSPMSRWIAAAIQIIDGVEKRTPQLVELAELVADRHIAGGMIGVIWEPPMATGPQGPQYEIKGRSGGLTALDVNLARKLGDADRAKDVAIIGWQREPEPESLDILRKYRSRFFIIAFGPRELPALAGHIELCDAWIDTGLGADDRMVELPDGSRAGRGNALANALNAWAFQAELVAAMTRRGKMPTLLKSHAWDDSKEWNGRYRGKMRFHDDLTVDPVPAGVLSRRYLDAIRGLVDRFASTQAQAVQRTAGLIAVELAHGRQTVVAQTGHTSYEFVGRYEDAVWARPAVLYATPGRMKQYPDITPDGALVLRLGYSGLESQLADILRAKQQRIMLITTTADPRPDYQLTPDLVTVIDMGYAFGDASVQIEGYPIRVFPPSGVMQLLAYNAVNVEVLARVNRPAP